MAKIYQTYDRLEAIEDLLQRHKHVMVHFHYRCIRRVRMPTKTLKCEICNAWQPYANLPIERWQANGGLLLYRPMLTKKHVPAPECDAVVMVECPLQMVDLEEIASKARYEAVVYRPTTWMLHEETIDHFFPRGSAYQLLDTITKAFVGRQLDPDLEACCKLSGFKSPVAFTAWDIEQLTGWSERYLKFLLKHRYKSNQIRYERISRRYRPSEPEMLVQTYDTLLAQAEISRGTYALPFGKPWEKKFTQWLKMLLRGSYAVREENIYVMEGARKPLDYDRIDAVNNVGRGRWLAVRSMVDDADFL